MRFVGASLAFVLPLIGLTGCTRGLETSGFQSRVVAAPPDEVFQAGQLLLRREFGRLTVEPDVRQAVSQPVEYHTSAGSGTTRDLYRGRSTMRRIAHFSVVRRSDQSVARLRIDVERQDTARREVFRPESYRLSDAPSQTPIERDAATTTRQNTVWTFVRRDRSLERALLAELEERFAPKPEEMEGTSSAGQPAAETP